MRITSRMYRMLALIYFLCIIVLPVAFFDEKQPVYIVLLFIVVILLLILFLWASLNFLDIYLQDGNELQCFFYGKKIKFFVVRAVLWYLIEALR